MYRNLLVPLDGSHLAEAVLPVAEVLARHLGAVVTLLHVVERNAPLRVHGDRHLCDPQEAQVYLGTVAERLERQGLTVSCHVHEVAQGDVARSIGQHSEELENDLILLSTHGRGGMRGFLVGSIAQQVMTTGTTPVLVVHPGTTPVTFACRRMAVPLDGTARHEHSIPIACELARSCGASIHLVTVVPRPEHLGPEHAVTSRMLPLTAAAQLDMEEQEAARYLERVAARVCGSSALAPSEKPSLTAQVRRGDPAAELTRYFREIEPDIVIMATHALKGWDAFWAGSVTPRVLSQWGGPVLLVRAGRGRTQARRGAP